MRTSTLFGVAAGFFAASNLTQPAVSWSAETSTTETVVLLRHGEKPPRGLGQLDCQGLNRALALPRVIARKFGRPAAIFAPDPSQTKLDDGVSYDYVRPLATIEPTAIWFGLPIDASIGVDNINVLRSKIVSDTYKNSFVLVAWEHRLIDDIARNLMREFGGNPERVPTWRGEDFDSIYILKIKTDNKEVKIEFAQDKEGLDGQARSCPGMEH